MANTKNKHSHKLKRGELHLARDEGSPPKQQELSYQHSTTSFEVDYIGCSSCNWLTKFSILPLAIIIIKNPPNLCQSGAIQGSCQPTVG